MVIDLFYNKSKNKYYYIGRPYCVKCDSLLDPSSFYVKLTHRIRIKKDGKVLKKVIAEGFPYCHACLSSVKEEHEKKKILSVDVVRVLLAKPPKGSIAVVIKPDVAYQPGKDLSGTHVWGAAIYDKNISASTEQVQVNDMTLLADRESWGGAQIGLDPENADSKDQVLDDDAVDSLLLDLQTAEPVLEHDKKRFIE